MLGEYSHRSSTEGVTCKVSTTHRSSTEGSTCKVNIMFSGLLNIQIMIIL